MNLPPQSLYLQASDGGGHREPAPEPLPPLERGSSRASSYRKYMLYRGLVM